MQLSRTNIMNIRIGDRVTQRFSNTATARSDFDGSSITSRAAMNFPPHILVVDKDPIICRQLERLYSQCDYQVTITNLAEQALEMLEDHDIDLVVTDIRAPG